MSPTKLKKRIIRREEKQKKNHKSKIIKNDKKRYRISELIQSKYQAAASESLMP